MSEPILNSKKDFLSLIIAILAIHMYVIGIATQSISLIVVSAVDGLIAFLLGIRTNSDYGHAGLIIGLIILGISLITLFVVFN